MSVECVAHFVFFSVSFWEFVRELGLHFGLAVLLFLLAVPGSGLFLHALPSVGAVLLVVLSLEVGSRRHRAAPSCFSIRRVAGLLRSFVYAALAVRVVLWH